uniref:Glucosamine inositolphosphorylceramide transferase 1 n=1 Tax=Kalanchoe fedtschenkoi TaxID=63787 RepID=A0A7N0RJ56_KALFE
MGSANGNWGNASGGNCCDMGLKCWCRWRSRSLGPFSTASLFFTSSIIFLCFVVTLYFWVFFAPPAGRCQPDNEGSWSIGLFYGDSPFDLKPLEHMNVWRNESAAWPLANPVLTCDSVSERGFPSNFVADPFLYVQGDTLYMFYETKNSITAQGDVGVAKSVDNGVTWEPLGIALDEDWHLSVPYVFEYEDEIFMIPESSQKQEVHLYRAVNFPLHWTLEKIILRKPLVDSVIVFHGGLYWLFGSHHSHFGFRRTTKLDIWYSSSPLCVWSPHKKNPVYNNYRNLGTRNGGRPFMYNGELYRVIQEAGDAYGRGVRVSKIEVLNEDEFKEVEVPLGFVKHTKGRNAWNGARYHHLDVQKLSDGTWIAAMDGDRVLSGDLRYRVFLGFAHLLLVAGLVLIVGVLLGAVKCHMPLSLCRHDSGKRIDFLLAWDRTIAASSKFRRFYSRLNRSSNSLRGILKLNSHTGRLLLVLASLLGAFLMCAGFHYIYGGSGAQEAYPVNGHYSQFTLLTMTYDARLWNLKMCVQHYSRCPSVREIVVVWNKGTPPNVSDFDSAVPVRIRVEEHNSLNNRFRHDPLIKTRAVLELDDDIMMTCDDIERGFKVWREHPEQLVGYYPRLIKGSPLKYRGEKFARTFNGYNMILTGAAFMDAQVAFGRYWSEAAKVGREMVDRIFNCEDVLMNYLYANCSSSSRTVQYVRPTWAIDTSKFSGAAISRNTNVHYQKRSECLEKFSDIYGSLDDQKWEFNSRKDRWDA